MSLGHRPVRGTPCLSLAWAGWQRPCASAPRGRPGAGDPPSKPSCSGLAQGTPEYVSLSEHGRVRPCRLTPPPHLCPQLADVVDSESLQVYMKPPAHEESKAPSKGFVVRDAPWTANSSEKVSRALRGGSACGRCLALRWGSCSGRSPY